MISAITHTISNGADVNVQQVHDKCQRNKLCGQTAQLLGEGTLQKYSELWLEHPAMPTLAAMVNDDRAWLTFFRAIEDPGFHSCNPDYTGPADAVLDYIVANGQGDEYPVSWTYPTETALQAAEHFYLYGERAPFITWCADFDEETT